MQLNQYLEFRTRAGLHRLKRVIVEFSASFSADNHVKYVSDCNWINDNYDSNLEFCNVYLLTDSRESEPVVVCAPLAQIVNIDAFQGDTLFTTVQLAGIEKSLPQGDKED